MPKIRLNKNLTSPKNEVNTFKEDICQMSTLQFKVFSILLQVSQYEYINKKQYSHKNDRFHTITIKEIKKILGSKQNPNYYLNILEELQSIGMIDLGITPEKITTKIDIIFTINDYEKWVEPNNNEGKEKDLFLPIEYILNCKSHLNLFLTMTGYKFKDSKDGYSINASVLYDITGLDKSDKEKRRISKKKILAILKNKKGHFKDISHEGYIFKYRTQDLMEMIEDKKEKKAVKTKKEKTKKVEKTNFNKDKDFKEEVKKDVVFDDIYDLTAMDDFELETSIKEIPTSETIKTDIDLIDLEDAFGADGMPFNKSFDYRGMHRNAMKIKSFCFKKKKY